MRNILKKAEELKFPVLLFLGKDGGKSLQWVAPRIKEVGLEEGERRVPELLAVSQRQVHSGPHGRRSSIRRSAGGIA